MPLASGTRLGPYEIVSVIGAGGMGVVYRACDLRLERDVAVKVLPPGVLNDPSARKRFRQEALAISKLNHPGVCTVHDVGSQEGTDFLVMELVPGITLEERIRSGSLPEGEVANLGAQMADALASAHDQQIVHRDLKPGNLRLTPDGRLKILDFGLARSLRTAAALSTTQSIVETEGVSGTLPYMAPEQLRNEPVDQRSDLWAAGAVLYELATGKRPFDASSAVALAGDILHKVPSSLRQLSGQLSPGLEAIILKCLEKQPAQRYQSARELAADLRKLAAGEPVAVTALPRQARRSHRTVLATVVMALAAALIGWIGWGSMGETRGPTIRTLAVMPLQNLSGDPDQDYFADGLTDALITDLSRIEKLKVIARGSVAPYRKEGKTLADLARDLKVDAVLDGTVLRSGNQLRISTQLINPPTSTNLWAQSYQRDVRDVLTLQSEVARAIADEIRLKISPQHQAVLARRRAVDPQTHEWYLRGRHFWNKRTLEDL